MKPSSPVQPRRLGYATLACLLVCSPFAASAEGHAEHGRAMGSSWSFSAAPYLWATGLEGNVGLLGFPAQPVDLDFGDILENLDMGFMGVMEARNGPYVVGVDLTYARISQSIGAPVGVAATGAEATVRNTMFTMVGGYDVAPGPETDVDVVAGFRYWSVDNELAFTGGLLDGIVVNDGDDWVDPVIGVKFRTSLSESWDLAGWALLGGFGVASDEMWDVMAGAAYSVRDNISLFVGYRAAGVDYSQNGFVFDTIQSGPVIGGVFRF